MMLLLRFVNNNTTRKAALETEDYLTLEKLICIRTAFSRKQHY